MNNASPPIFIYNKMVVGEFSKGYPTDSGDFTYMPYRGPGHFQMQQTLKKEHKVTCTFAKGPHSFTMVITSSPRYGVLTVSELNRTKSITEPGAPPDF